MEITAQEAWTRREGRDIRVPSFVREVIERVAFEARGDKRIDKRSGVSQRLPISLLEHAISSAERRALVYGERVVVPRISDVYMAIPSITGKLELEYEGELQGGDTIAKELIRRAAGATMDEHLGDIALDSIVHWFDGGGALKVKGDEKSESCLKGFSLVPGLVDAAVAGGLAERGDPPVMVAACELILEGLAAEKRISRSEELGYVRARPERRDPMGGQGKGLNLG
jgi:magnesium chelatase subunit I